MVRDATGAGAGRAKAAGAGAVGPAVTWPWAGFGIIDPRPDLLVHVEPAAGWITLTGVLDRPADDPQVVAAHAAVLADPATRALLDRIPDWTAGDKLSGHDSPRYAPNLLGLLADHGVLAADDERIARLLGQMLEHQDEAGRFLSFGTSRASSTPRWGTLPCDHHAILEALVRDGHTDDPRVQTGLSRLAGDLTATAQGAGWLCLPHTVTGFRGPGRRSDMCPQVTSQALRVFSHLSEPARPAGLLDAARVLLRVWRQRGVEQPYMFGHGRRFKVVKWPATWYHSLTVLDGLGRYPALWRGADADPADRGSLAELVACLVRYNVADDGTVTPRSAFRGCEAFSFGQKREPSGFATARVFAVLHRLEDLAAQAANVDISALGSSKGGTGTPRMP